MPPPLYLGLALPSGPAAFGGIADGKCPRVWFAGGVFVAEGNPGWLFQPGCVGVQEGSLRLETWYVGESCSVQRRRGLGLVLCGTGTGTGVNSFCIARRPALGATSAVYWGEGDSEDRAGVLRGPKTHPQRKTRCGPAGLAHNSSPIPVPALGTGRSRREGAAPLQCRPRGSVSGGALCSVLGHSLQLESSMKCLPRVPRSITERSYRPPTSKYPWLTVSAVT